MNMLIYHGPCTTSVITAANLPSVFANTNHCGLFFSLIFFLFFFSPKTQSARDQYCLSVLSPPTQPHPTEMPRVPSVCRETMVGWQPCPTWPTGSPGRRTGWNSPVRLSTRAHTSLRRRSKKSASTVSELWDLFFFTKHIFILVLERSMGVRLWKTRNAKKKKKARSLFTSNHRHRMSDYSLSWRTFFLCRFSIWRYSLALVLASASFQSL